MKNGVVISLFDYTGNMVKPWAEAGYECHIFDIKHDQNYCRIARGIHAWRMDLRNNEKEFNFWIGKTAITFAFPPCDHLAVSGARWFKGKGLRKLAESIDMFATAAEVCDALKSPYMIENPVSTISTYWRKPDYTFHPCDYTAYNSDDNYFKKTCLWTGNGFVMPDKECNMSLAPPDHRIHCMPPCDDRKNKKSITPMGFAKAVFEANRKG